MKEEFDVVIANINRNILLNDMTAFRSHLKTGGRLILSGFYETDVPMLEQAAQSNGLTIIDVVTDGEWACAMFECK